MAALQESAPQDPSTPNPPLAQGLGRSPSFRALVALLVLAGACGIAWLVREYPDYAAKMLAMVLVGWGGLAAWRLLPLSSRTQARLAEARTRWRKEDERWGDSWVRLFRFGLWLGPLMLYFSLFDEFWKSGAFHFPPGHKLIAPVSWFAVGLIAHLLQRYRSGRQLP